MKKHVLAMGLVAATLVGAQGCYRHSFVNPDVQPGQVGDSSWNHHLFWGLINASGATNLKAACPNGVAEVKDRWGFLNMLVSMLTGGIYSPTTVEVVCASGRAATVKIEPTAENASKLRKEYPGIAEWAVKEKAALEKELGPTRVAGSPAPRVE